MPPPEPPNCDGAAHGRARRAGQVRAFLDVCDPEGRVAVHCRAGLGRTGTLVALYLLRAAGVPARAAVGWLRVVRPGSVVGPQQGFLCACEARGWDGNALRAPQPPARPSPDDGAATPPSPPGSDPGSPWHGTTSLYPPSPLAPLQDSDSPWRGADAPPPAAAGPPSGLGTPLLRPNPLGDWRFCSVPAL